jgi:hypothetical protein
MVKTAPFYDCIAVSDSDDATGSWEAYEFASNFGSTYLPDYPKLGVWPAVYPGFPQGVYLLSVDVFVASDGSYNGPDVCFLDRGAMLAGLPATRSQCSGLPSGYEPGLIPSDLDGNTAPPAGEPGFFMTWENFGVAVEMVKLTPCYPNCDTVTSAPIAVPDYTPYFVIAGHGSNCTYNGVTRNGEGMCDIPEASGDGTYLDSNSDLTMYRLAYRNFGTHESLVFNHTVLGVVNGVDEVAGIRWYEIQNPSGNPVVAQVGTWAPGYQWRWMGSTAMDRVGDQALGYSMSETQITGYPGPIIAITGRTPTDPPGTMEPEYHVVTSAGYQNGGQTRWGDYSSMQIDPVDDCTFWYTQEYTPLSGPANWATHVVAFKFPNCEPPSPTTTGVASNSNPSKTGQAVTFTATTLASGSGSTSPTGAVTFNDSLTVLGTGTLNGSGTTTFTTSGLSMGQHSISAAYGGDSNNAGSSSTPLTQIVNGDFALALSPTSASVSAGASASYTLSTTPQGYFGTAISFSCKGLPALASCTFTPSTLTPNGSAASSTLAVGTTAPTALLMPPASGDRSNPLGIAWIWLPAAMVDLLRRLRGGRLNLRSYIPLWLIAGSCLLQYACGGGGGGGGGRSQGTGGTPTGTYTVTVTATAGSTTHTTTATLVVQ